MFLAQNYPDFCGSISNFLEAHQRKFILALIAAGIVLRVLVVLYYNQRQSWGGDTLYYYLHGQHLYHVGQYPSGALPRAELEAAIRRGIPSSSATPIEDKMPGLAALVATGHSLFGEKGARLFPLMLFAVSASLATAGLWWLISPELRPSAQVPSFAILQFGIMELTVMVFRLMPDMPTLVLGISFVCALVAASRRHTYFFSACAGLSAGLALYIRPDYLLLPLVCGPIWCLLVRKTIGQNRALRGLAVALATTAILLVPWGMRNYASSGTFRIFNNQGQRALWYSFNEGFRLDWDMSYQPLHEPWQGTPVEQHGAIAAREAKSWLFRHPLTAAFLVCSRLTSHFTPVPCTQIGAAAMQLKPGFCRRIFRGISVLFHESWIVLGLTALVCARRLLPLSLTLLGVCTLCRLAVACLYPDGGRYALMLIPFLACCAVWFVGRKGATSFAHWRLPALRGIAVVTVIQLIFFLVWGLPNLGIPSPVTWISFADH